MWLYCLAADHFHRPSGTTNRIYFQNQGLEARVFCGCCDVAERHSARIAFSITARGRILIPSSYIVTHSIFQRLHVNYTTFVSNLCRSQKPTEYHQKLLASTYRRTQIALEILKLEFKTIGISRKKTALKINIKFHHVRYFRSYNMPPLVIQIQLYQCVKKHTTLTSWCCCGSKKTLLKYMAK